MLFRSVLRIPMSLQIYTTLRKSSLKYSIFSSAYKAVKSFLIVLLLTNQSGISFNVATESSTALSSIFGATYQGTILRKKDLQKQLYHTFLEFYINQEEDQVQKTYVNCFITYFLSHKAFRNKFYCRRIRISCITHF